jgi:hypothetical protein
VKSRLPIFLLAAVAAAPASAQEKSPAMESAKAKFVVETMATGLENPRAPCQ